jgi:group I intron endonuclease
MIIYKATNKINGKSYIGQTTKTLEERIKGHLRSNKKLYFHQALREFSNENFEWIILEECNNIEELNIKEIYYIKFYDTCGDNGYNSTTGGHYFKMTDEIRKKLSDSHKGYIPSEETRRKLSIASGKRKQTDESKRKVSESKLGKKRSEETKKKISESLKGNIVSEETRKKLSEAGKGRKHTEESKLKMKKYQNENKIFGKKHSEETKKKMSESHKKLKNKN